MGKNPKPAKKDVGSSPGKKAALPRRNKTGKRPITKRRSQDLLIARVRSRNRRQRTITADSYPTINKKNPGEYGGGFRREGGTRLSGMDLRYREKASNPGKDLASHAEMQRVRRNEGSQAVDRRKKKVKNPKGG